METKTTSNGYEIQHPTAEMSSGDFRRKMSEVYGINGSNPQERVAQFQQLSVEGVAIMLEDINMSLQGSGDSLMAHDKTMKVGETLTLPPEDRYQVFLDMVNELKLTAADVNPARIGDVLALGVVMLHPFHDGNGRTARTIGLLFRDNYDEQSYADDYDIVTEPRDNIRGRGGFVINGYVPNLPEGSDSSSPVDVSTYLIGLLHNEAPDAYTSCFGQATLVHATE